MKMIEEGECEREREKAERAAARKRRRDGWRRNPLTSARFRSILSLQHQQDAPASAIPDRPRRAAMAEFTPCRRSLPC